MPLGEVAKCSLCKVFASGEELVLNRSEWDYQCKDYDACVDRRIKSYIDGPYQVLTSGFVSIAKVRKS